MAKADNKPSAGQKHRDQAAKRSRERTAELNEIGKLPVVVNPKRKSACRGDLHRFLVEFFPNSTGLKPFGADQRRMIAHIQHCILKGGQYLNVFPRGFVKTTISENSAIWAALYGHRKFIPIVMAESGLATLSIDSIKMELMENDRLLEDFPEVCHPLREIDWKPLRCVGQTYHGRHTHVDWTADDVVLPTIPRSRASGAVIVAKGITAASRGIKRKHPDGRNLRPDLWIVDDPQTDESAGSKLQTQALWRIIKKAIGRSGGHSRRASIVVNATPILPGDLVAQLADPVKNPAWQVERSRMLRAKAKAEETFWLSAYAQARNTFDRGDPDDKKRANAEATGLYRARQSTCGLSLEAVRPCSSCARYSECADADCVVSWGHCYSEEEGELSAVQHAYNVLVDEGPEVFSSECQSEPYIEPESAANQLTAEAIASRLSQLDRGRVGKECQHLSAYVDVHGRLLYWVVSAWDALFGGGPIDYGPYPEQPIAYFAQASAPRSMSDRHPGTVQESWILASLGVVVDRILAAEFPREDGAALRVGMVLVDAKWGETSELVKRFCRRHPAYGTRLFPAMGVGVGPTRKKLTEYRPEPGARIGQDWREAPGADKTRVVTIDANAWKSFTAKRLRLPIGTPGGWCLFGRSPVEHQLFADHCAAEEPKTLVVKGTNHEYEQWVLKPNRDNHYWDCLVGSGVGASMLGVVVPGLQPVASRRRPASERPTAAELAMRGKR